MSGQSPPSMGYGFTFGLGATLILFLLSALLSYQHPLDSKHLAPQEPLVEEREFTPPEIKSVPAPLTGEDASTSISLLRGDGTVETITMDQYLWSVVAAEMPASFPLEALKAQAVAARTYTALRLENPKHQNAQLCDDSSCCQAFLDPEERLPSWGSDATLFQEKISQAIAETDGLHVLYQGKPIDAVFFSSSAGQTLQALEVWGNDTAYLQSVPSPEGEEVPNYHSQVSYSPQELQALLQSQYPQIQLSDSPQQWFSQWVADSIGGVAQMTLGGITLTGAQLRAVLGLRSSFFTVSYADELFTFHVTGYGHNVGMSQYGAKAMGDEGQNFEEILKWYYQDTVVSGYGLPHNPLD